MTSPFDSNNVLDYPYNAMWTAPLGAALPTACYPAAFPSGWSPLGRVTNEGFAGGREVNTTTETDSTGVVAFEGDSELRETYTFTGMEINRATENLKYPGSIQTIATAGTAEVQNVSLSGTPTGGTFTPVYRGVAGSTPVAYNANAATFQTALRTIPALATATVATGTGPWDVTLPAGEGDAPALQFINALSGGTNPSVAATQTTPGVLPTYKWVTLTSGITGGVKRLFGLDEVNVATGRGVRKLFVGKIRATDLGSALAGTSKKSPFVVTKFEDLSVGGLEVFLSNLPAHAPNTFV